MKKRVLSIISGLVVTFNVFSQINLDVYGNFNDDHINVISVKSLNYGLRSTSSQPIIINTIPSPTLNPCDIAFDGISLWVAAALDSLLYQISPIDGSVLKTIPISIQRPYGLEFINGYLWVADNSNHLIVKVDTSNGNSLYSFPTPSLSPNSYPGGLAWDGQFLWHNDPTELSINPDDSTFKISTTGQSIERHHAFGTTPTGLAWDGQYLWSSDNRSLEIYKIDILSFSVIDSINAPGGLYPNGLAFDGQYLWVVSNDADSLYQIDISNTNTGLAQIAFPNNAIFLCILIL